AIADAVASDMSTALFVFFEQFPFSMILSIIGIIMIIGFFVTSADSGSLVIVSLTSGGKLESPVGLRVFWAMGVGVIAAVLLIGGGLQALQTAAIVTGLPFSIILLMMCFSLYKGLKEEMEEEIKAGKTSERKAYQQLIGELLAKRAQKKENKDVEDASPENKTEPKP
ncbi:MAG TPA: BCCT family transporter, partial [Cyclobacteriaceae bacterium]|nr:BCCT family transporter [Cyclobacteriaceae bacterium]